ncbi:hypothetical protein ANTRET_LOCUS9537 [Anthophora retusa]
MQRYTTEQRTKIIEFYFENQRSIVLTQRADFNWPSRSPDLTAPDCFLWAYLKERVYVNKPATIPQLKTNIRNEIRAITPVFLRKVMENVLERARMCKAENGRHLQDIIFHV